MPTIECSRFHFISNLSLSIFSLEYRSLFLWFDIVFCDHYRLVSNWVLFTLDHWLLWHSFTDISPFEFGIFYCVLYRVFSISILLVRLISILIYHFLPQSNRTFLGNFTYPFSKTLSFSLHYVCIWWLFFLALFIDISPFKFDILYSALYHFFSILILLVRFYQNTHLPFLLLFQSNRTLIELFQNILLLPPLRLHSHINHRHNT